MIYRNIKNQKLYKLISSTVVNTTNSHDGTLMVLYKDAGGKKFVREREEFFKKFEELKVVKL